MIKLKIKEAAIEKGWSQTKLQRAANIHPQTMQNIFQETIEDIKVGTLFKIARALEVEPFSLVEEVPDKKV